MTTQTALPRGTRSQSPSAKFYSRTFSTRNTPHSEGQGPAADDVISSAPHSKRRRLNPESDTETANEARLGRYLSANARVPQKSISRQRDVGRLKRITDSGLGGSRPSRTSSGNAYTKRASALNLHNYPADHHPVGIAIWVIQKIDSARRERNGSTSSRESTPGAFLPSSLSAGFFQGSGQGSEVDEGDDPTDRRQAQRDRKIKQRLENWAKNKENDVVARAKLDAKKKFGSNPSTNPILLSNGQVEKPSPSDEKESYIRRRIREDFSRLMNRQTKVFAGDISKLEPFQVGFSRKCFPTTNLASGSVVTAGTLLVNVLPALAEKEVSRTSQLAADSLIQALETGSLSPESFFDAIAILAENKDILVGSNRILAQLFSRSSSSGNSKVLRTSSGADSKLFATTNGPFIIYNTIENTETTTPPSSRYSGRSSTSTNSALARASPRERKSTAKMLSVSEVSTRPKSRSSMSPRNSPPKLLKLTRPSKLRGSVSFAKSPSPPRKRVKLINDHVSGTDDPHDGILASEPQLAPPERPKNQYRSEQATPPSTTSDSQSHPQAEIKMEPTKSLLDWALFAYQEDTDEFEPENQEARATNGNTEVDSILSIQPSPGWQNNEQQPSNTSSSSTFTACGHDHTLPFDLAATTSADQIAKFNRIVDQLPNSQSNLSDDQVKKMAALYDQIASGPTFERAKELGLSYPEIPRPFSDKGGWKLTGVINQFGEEIVEVDRQSWVYAPGSGEEAQQFLRRLKRKHQIEQELIFGFPPTAGYGIEPRRKGQRLDEGDEENVAYEKLTFDIRGAAEARGLPCDKTLSWEDLANSIKCFDASHGITFEEAETAPVVETVDDEPNDDALSQEEASDVSEVDSEGDSDYEPDPVVTRNVEEAWIGSGGAQMSTFVTVNGRRGSLRKLRGRPSSSSSAGGTHNRAMDISTILDPNHAEMSPPASITRYDIRPPPLSGTFNTFNGPITSSNTPSASPVLTPSYMKLNFNLNSSRKQSSTSPAPSNTTHTFTSNTRRPSTASISSSSFASRPTSAQPLDIDNANAYNVSKGYATSTPNTPTPYNNAHDSHGSSSTTDPSTSPNGNGQGGLNGGFPGGGIIINAPDRRGGSGGGGGIGGGGDGRGQRRKSKAPDFKMNVQKAGKEGPKRVPRAVRGGTVLKFT